MKASVVPIGNSRGIRIPKAILAQCNIKESVILEIEKNKIVIIPEHKKIGLKCSKPWQITNMMGC